MMTFHKKLMCSPKKKHYYNPWFFKRFKLINKSFFINGHVHFN